MLILVLWKLVNAKMNDGAVCGLQFAVLANPLPSSDLLLIGRSIGKDLNLIGLQVKSSGETVIVFLANPSPSSDLLSYWEIN